MDCNENVSWALFSLPLLPSPSVTAAFRAYTPTSFSHVFSSFWHSFYASSAAKQVSSHIAHPVSVALPVTLLDKPPSISG
ncbi:hypothetical protein PISMIDRAFT_678403 [Pisolithus microcarpus 441]|uniref:Uncharacterized protein n=1 Tax=Pisolithus microcarpus 441 TaxID=765257 RepID=A0A0C9YGY8_9AGAM|nr:hypothetical protein BKA83DRAFT_678403 [Pisolithus microcarpus]KIK24225.1 hypothetical protein PISMIDRAFT_678403 [Pisolithus microcarpus 441]